MKHLSVWSTLSLVNYAEILACIIHSEWLSHPPHISMQGATRLCTRSAHSVTFVRLKELLQLQVEKKKKCPPAAGS